MNPADVRRIADLARLATTDDELEHYAQELTAILAMVAAMNAVATGTVEPLAHPSRIAQRLRPDQVTEQDERARFQAIAPLTQDDLYLVPRVIE